MRFLICKTCLEVFFVAFNLFQIKAKICLFLLKNSCSFGAAIIYLLLAVYKLMYGEYFSQSNRRIDHVQWMTVS